MSREFGERIDVRDFPEELGADDRPRKREQHWPKRDRRSETMTPTLRRDSLLVKKLE